MNDKLFLKLKQSYSYIGLAESVLKSHADALAGLGLVTEDNIDEIVSKQKDFLEGLQRYNDSRVTEAVRKAGEKALKEAEEKAAKEAEEAAAKAREDAEKALPDSVRTLLETIKSEREAERAQAEEAARKAEEARQAEKADWQKRLDEMGTVISGFQKENERRAKEEAARQRKAGITAKAKELGIPQYRIDEGFAIPDDADDTAINEHLSAVAKNIKAQTLPSGAGALLTGGEVSKEDVDSIAKSLVDRL